MTSHGRTPRVGPRLGVAASLASITANTPAPHHPHTIHASGGHAKARPYSPNTHHTSPLINNHPHTASITTHHPHTIHASGGHAKARPYSPNTHHTSPLINNHLHATHPPTRTPHTPRAATPRRGPTHPIPIIPHLSSKTASATITPPCPWALLW
jgi:hypothetical protein